MRPLRLYKHTFVHATAAPLVIVRTGGTPCQAKSKAFRALEEELVAKGLPRPGWRLQKQEDVTHLASA